MLLNVLERLPVPVSLSLFLCLCPFVSVNVSLYLFLYPFVSLTHIFSNLFNFQSLHIRIYQYLVLVLQALFSWRSLRHNNTTVQIIRGTNTSDKYILMTLKHCAHQTIHDKSFCTLNRKQITNKSNFSLLMSITVNKPGLTWAWLKLMFVNELKFQLKFIASLDRGWLRCQCVLDETKSLLSRL